MRIQAPRRATTLLVALTLHMAASSASAPAPQARPAPSTDAPTLDQVKHATITGVFDRPVTLKDGVYEGPPSVEGGASRPRLTLIDTLAASGNLDDTPALETVVLLSETSGASGERIYVAVVAGRGDGVRTVGTALIGDRTRIRSLTVVERAIVMDVVEAGPEDAMCCPSQLARKSFALESGTLELISSETTGPLSIEVLAGANWRLVRLDDEPVPKDVEAPTLAIEGASVAGFGGCNRYSGTVAEEAPGRIAVGRLLTTRMACPPPVMDLETRFLDTLGKADQYSFLMGRLVLTAVEGERITQLEFAGRP